MRKTLLLLCSPFLFGKVKEFSQKVEFGYFGTSGNSSVNSLTAAYKLSLPLSFKSEIALFSDLLYATREGDKSGERYRGRVDFSYYYTTSFYNSLEVKFLRDPFKGYNQQYSFSPGVGYEVNQDLHLILGYEFRRDNYTMASSKHFNYLKGSFLHKKSLTSQNSLKTTLDFIENLENSIDFEMELETSLKLHIVNDLSFKLSFEYRYDNLPPPTKRKFDTVTKATLVYKF
ncbi:MAG: DUF481 domain-containing protein [Epsilonproteobacteria bacterium]|nr:DUF481 domain-containing protein [Campylobacterota bacterium]